MKPSWMLLVAAIVVPLVGNMMSVYIWLPLLSVPYRASIRPMLQPLQSFGVIFGTLAAGIRIGFSLISSERRIMGWCCIFFSATPILVGGLAANWFSAIRHLNWAD